MVKNSTLTYGENLLKAREYKDPMEVGEVLPDLLEKFKSIIEDAVHKNYEKGVKGKYYIHIWIQKTPYAMNSLHIYPQCRRTRPSPYQGNDHFLWSVEDGGKVTFEWCIPKKEQIGFILANPNDYDPEYVSMLRKFVKDKIESIEDYQVKISGKKVII